MKKILILLLPLFICIAIFFTIQDRNFSFMEMLNTFSNWSFADSLDAFVEMRNTFNEVGNIWSDFTSFENGFFESIALIGDLIVSLLTGLGQLLLAIGYLVIDFVDNILQIVSWLFGYRYTT